MMPNIMFETDTKLASHLSVKMAEVGGEHADLCKICFDLIKVKQELKETAVCKHLYHVACMEEYLIRNIEQGV